MSSPSNPLGDPAKYDVMFWLPPHGVDNGVWATYWAELADLQLCDVGPVLALLANADIGGYVATPGGRAHNQRRPPIHRLWVDSLRYHGAEDVLMAYLNRKSQRTENFRRPAR